MRVIGGMLAWDPERRLTIADAAPMTRRLSGARPAAEGPVILFSTLKSNGLEIGNEVSVVADLALTNVEELVTLVGHCLGPDLIVALYAREGEQFVRRLQGAFALAVWDQRRRTLLLAVDRFGIKRLHWVAAGRLTAFASRAGLLAGLPGVDARPDPVPIFNYLNLGFVPGPDTVFAGVRRLAPGRRLVVTEGRERVETYWDLQYCERPVGRDDAAATVHRLTEAAVARALGDVTPKQAGAFLSGGTDSSTVVGLMGKVTGEHVNAFSVGFREKRYDELAYAELAARHFGAAHFTKVVNAGDVLEMLPDLVDAYDEPFGNNSALGTLACARLARDCGVTRLLAGDGGDEIFGGNERYRIDRIFSRYHRIPAAVRQGLLEPVLMHLPDGGVSIVGRAQRYVRRANLPNPRRFYSYEFFFSGSGADLLTPELRAAAADAPYRVLEGHWRRARATDELNRLLYLDLKLTIGDNDLLKVTRGAELAGVDVAFPLLDLALVEYMAALPARHKVRGLEKRYLFKHAFRALLPRETLVKPKHGFGVPTSEWIRNDPGVRGLVQDTLLSARARQRGYFASGALERLFELHAAESSPYYGDILWTVFMLELWHRRHVDGVSVP